MGKTIFACAGQGVQKPGMGWYLAWNDAAREVYEVASSVCGTDVWKLTQTASQDELNLTKNAQPALVALEIAEAHASWPRASSPTRCWASRSADRRARDLGHALA